ncbi:MAG: MoxR family ATPase [Bryobacteraceae bacterium]|nr:MoxR family ATPase [Bryobacteraceae bacterium]MDW8377221.1 MoxR family ATPase [Bryobacterales bacterium]
MSQREIVTAPPAGISLSWVSSRVAELEETLGMAIRGKPEVVRLSLVCLLAKGHLLIEDVPGVGKTTLAQALARSVRCSFHRLQFTSDMLPSDVLGVTVYNAQTAQFEFKPGPIFTNFLLGDEINRATPKTQSALLEAMNERQVTIDGRSYPLEEPFMVVATQNPVEHHGTYPLPESQLDRFLMRLRMGYPDQASEREILQDGVRPQGDVRPVLNPDELVQLQSYVPKVRVDEALVDYMLAIVGKTRHHDSLSLGVSPRGAKALYRATQALALIEGREYAIPDDVKRLVLPVFAHRLVLHHRVAPLQRSHDLADRILQEILTLVEVPL